MSSTLQCPHCRKTFPRPDRPTLRRFSESKSLGTVVVKCPHCNKASHYPAGGAK